VGWSLFVFDPASLVGQNKELHPVLLPCSEDLFSVGAYYPGFMPLAVLGHFFMKTNPSIKCIRKLFFSTE
jgi:hypothetical protein